MTLYRRVPLGDVLILQRGFDITRADQREGSIPVVSSSGVNSFHDTAMVQGPGVVIGRKGSLGTAFFMKGPYWPHDTTLWVKDFKANNPLFCYYLLKSLDLAKYDVGAANPTLNRNHVHLLDVPCPPVSAQRRIAPILGAYDDLIEVNRRRIAVLEEMARRLFEEWFVHFRFPGHEALSIKQVGDDFVPEGWLLQTIGESFDLLGGGTPSKAEPEFWDPGEVEWYTPSDLTGAKTVFMDRSGLRISRAGLQRSSAHLFPPYSVMMTSRATIGAIAINTTAATTNQGFITCLPNDHVPLAFMYHWLQWKVPVFIAHGTGATFKEITKGVFRRLPIVVPPGHITAEFERQCRPMLDTVLALERSQRRLAESRDLLLPRLISGDLPVAAAERELEAVA